MDKPWLFFDKKYRKNGDQWESGLIDEIQYEIDKKATTKLFSQIIFDTDPNWSVSNIDNGIIHDLSYKSFLSLIGNRSRLIDIGANYGYSFSSFKNLGYDGPYLSIEPLPQHIPALSTLKNRFENFNFLSVGLDDHCGMTQICVPSYKGKANSSLAFLSMHHSNLKFMLRNLIPTEILEISKADIGLTWVEVPLRSLDCLLSSKVNGFSFIPDAMKIDVEGSEIKVLLGARKTISEYRPFLLIEGANRSPEVRGFLKSMNYTYLQIDNKGKIGLLDMDVSNDEINGMFGHSSKISL
jgi:FkbM family methyltransferase